MIDIYTDSVTEELGEPECESMLHEAAIGRVAFTDAVGPMVLPVNYTVSEGLIVFRTDSPSMLAHLPMRQVAFEIDGWDGPSVAWSVVARGHIREVSNALGERYEKVRTQHIPTFAPGPKHHWLALEPSSLTGRRLTIKVAALP